MMKILLVAFFCAALPGFGQPAMSGNPVFTGNYADPEAHIFGKRYWIYPTFSAEYKDQVFMDAFSSKELVHWTRHARIIDTAAVKWARYALWAPSVIKKGTRYFLFFGANDIQSNNETGGIGVAVAKRPQGPFRDYLGKPLIDKFYNGAQPIDQFVFKDDDGQYYLYYGGWGHCNVAKLNSRFTGFLPFASGAVFKEITPQGYVEGAYMLKRQGKYYFMWSEGGWTNETYSVAYAIANSPLGPFERVGKILQQDTTVATGAGHHSILHHASTDSWYIVYHRRPLGSRQRDNRVTCIDHLFFDEKGYIQPVKITREGVSAQPLQ